MKMSIRKTLFISLALLGVLGLATFAVSFFQVNRTVSVSGQFQYRAVTPVVAKESGFAKSILMDTESDTSAGTPIVVLENNELSAEIENLLNQVRIFELEIEGIRDQRQIDQLTAANTIASTTERLQIAIDNEQLRLETYQLNNELFKMGRVSEASIKELELQGRTATAERAELQSTLRAVELATSISETVFLRQISLKEMSLITAQNRLRQLELRHRNLTIRAPKTGVLFADTLDQKLNTLVSKGTKIGDVVSFDEINFTGYANGTDVIRIKKGQKVYFDVDIFRRKVFVQGTVTRVGYETQLGADGQYQFPIEIEVDNKAFIDREKELFIQAGVPGAAVIVVEEDLSLIALVWEKIVDFVDFEVYLR